ncbi:MAG TPA: hypothetical protein VEM96_08635 [Pyrinomonadaceae bacterium]|nr:hypothetical protein [Pyrinomonadaceae bacterium]
MPAKKKPASSFLKEVIDNTNEKARLFEIEEEEDGRYALSYGYVGESGAVIFYFVPDGLETWAIRTTKEAMNAVAAEHGVTTNKEIPEEDLQIAARILACAFLQGMHGKAGTLLDEMQLEFAVWLNGFLETSYADSTNVARPSFKKQVESLARAMISERKRFLTGSLAHLTRPRWNEMKAHYDVLLPLANGAKAVYEDHKSRDWHGMIKAGFPQFDDDLIILLSSDPADLERLPAHARKATENSEDYSKASNMALEQAARLCGMKPFKHGPRTLRGRMDEHCSVKTAEVNISPDEHYPVKSASDKISPKTPKARKLTRNKTSP